ncbi:hypothetical protein DFH11DRAFT_1542437 [Phellopilus nigrolimitatus]|nr:hypothetical protein DFH11DRAFT_1542437 [Phellopilus nigrolimitatus]
MADVLWLWASFSAWLLLLSIAPQTKKGLQCGKLASQPGSSVDPLFPLRRYMYIFQLAFEHLVNLVDQERRSREARAGTYSHARTVPFLVSGWVSTYYFRFLGFLQVFSKRFAPRAAWERVVESDTRDVSRLCWQQGLNIVAISVETSAKPTNFVNFYTKLNDFHIPHDPTSHWQSPPATPYMGRRRVPTQHPRFFMQSLPEALLFWCLDSCGLPKPLNGDSRPIITQTTAV